MATTNTAPLQALQRATPATSSHPVKRLWQYASKFHRDFLSASTYSILNKLFDLAPPVLIGMAVDVVVQQENSILAGWGIESVSTQLIFIGVLTLIVWGAESFFEYLYGVRWRNLAQSIQHELREDTYSHTQSLDLSFYEERRTGGLMSILNDDINQLERFLDVGANDILQLLTTMIVVGAIFVLAVPELAWMVILPMPIIIWVSIHFQRLLEPRYSEVRERVGDLNAILANNLSGIATIKSFTAEKHETTRISQASDLYRDSNRRAISLSSAFVPLIRMAIVLGFVAILIFGGLQVIAGNLNVGAYSVLVFMTQRLLWPLTRLGQTLDLYQRSLASTRRIFSLLDTEPAIKSGSLRMPVADIRGDVRLDCVSFEYGVNASSPDESQVRHHVLRDLTLHVPAGETAALVGPTGAGKSTVVKLLLRFYDVQSGSVMLDDIDIRNIQLHDLRTAIGFVSQDVFLFHGTVRDNISYGSFDASNSDIIAAAKIAEAHDFIQALPEGYDTVVGERGQKLSGGQRQRISIARAVLKDPPVLILDEATSSVDNETEAAIQRSLDRIAVGRTTIIIAHRLSTIRNADRIFVLDKGILKEQASHDRLVNAGGIYASLWEVQTGTAVQQL